MKTKSLKMISAVVAGLFVLGTTAYAQQRSGSDTRTSRPVMEGTAITKEDAQKKYPPPASGYPLGTRDPHDASGVVASPYPPNQKYDCSKINHGGLVLDVRAKKVFIYP
jgi:hypothetical protein